MPIRPICLGLALLAGPAPSAATETQTYTYDAQGRLVQVARSGTVNAGVVTTYSHDDGDNRLTKTVSGSANPPVTP